MALINETVEQNIRRSLGGVYSSRAIVVQNLDDASLQDIERFDREILRSNHLGNNYPSNEAFVNTIPKATFCLYVLTTGKDQNYHPWTVRRGGVVHEIAESAPEDLLVPFFRPNSNFFNILETLPMGLQQARTPAQLHYQSLKLLHPETTTNSEWTLQNQELAGLITDVVGKRIPVFNRRVDTQGIVRKTGGEVLPNPGRNLIRSYQALQDAIVEGIPSLPQEVVLSDIRFNSFLDFIIPVLDPANQVVFDDKVWGVYLHASGPHMVQYVTQLKDDFVRLHSLLSRELPDLNIPDKIFFGVVPTASMRLALPQNIGGDALDRLAQAFITKGIRKTALKEGDLTDEARKILNEREKEARRFFRESISAPEIQSIDFSSEFSTHLSHYDLFGTNPIYFPTGLKHLTFREIDDLNKTIAEMLNPRRGGKK